MSFIRHRNTPDLSAGLVPPGSSSQTGWTSPFAEQTSRLLSRHGINSLVTCLAYDPVQSLLAVGTAESKYGRGRIYLFGAGRVQRVIDPPPPNETSSGIAGLGLTKKEGAASVVDVRFVCGGRRLLVLDGGDHVLLYDLAACPPGLVGRATYAKVACLATDPALEWALVGLQAGGDVMAFDLVSGRPAVGGGAWRLGNVWREREREKGRVAGLHSIGVVGVHWHPRDVGKLAVAYTEAVVVYSFKRNEVQKWLELPQHQTGKARITCAAWHPTGTFIVAGLDDGRLVVWDVKEGRVLCVRTVVVDSIEDNSCRRAPIAKLSWCCKSPSNPDDTALLILGGNAPSLSSPSTSTTSTTPLTFLDLGPTPTYATSSWDTLTQHFTAPKRLVPLPVPPGAEVASYTLIPRSSPHYHGACDPIAALVLLTSGEVVTLTIPSGYPISPTNMLPPSLSFIHPFVNRIFLTHIPRERWLGLVEKRQTGENFLRGGAPAPTFHGESRYPYPFRHVVLAAHADCTIRAWDVGFGRSSEIENAGQLQVDVARAVGRVGETDASGMAGVTVVGMSEVTAEMVAGTKGGEVVVWRWGVNNNNAFLGRREDEKEEGETKPGEVRDISHRTEPNLREGLMPLVLYALPGGKAPVSAVKVSDVGFVAAASENGCVSVLDLRGPAVIFQAQVGDLTREQDKRSSLLAFGKGKHAMDGRPEFATVLEFGVMTLGEDGYSSIACFVGTDRGRVVTLKILPVQGAGKGQPGYRVEPAGVSKVGSDRVMAVCPVNGDNGLPAAATVDAVAGLREGRKVDGILVVATQSTARVFKPPTSKPVASRSLDDISGHLCDAASVVYPPRSLSSPNVPPFAALLTLHSSGSLARIFSLPHLKELSHLSLPALDPARALNAAISRSGSILAWMGPSEIGLYSVWRETQQGYQRRDERYHGAGDGGDFLVIEGRECPARPTISGVEWVTGTQYVSVTDLGILIGGEGWERRREMEKQAAQGAHREEGGGTASKSQEGWGEYLARQIDERMERLNVVDDAMMKLQETTQGWSESVNNYVKKQKREALLGSIKKSFF